MKEAIILAGGFGTRLRKVVSDVPKPMAPMDSDGTPFLQLLLEYLRKEGIKHIVLATGYKSEMISDFFGNRYRDIEISYSVEKDPLLTGGAIKQALRQCTQESVFVLNGDTYFDVSLSDLKKVHDANGADLTIALKPMHGFERYGTVEIKGNRIISFHEKKYCDHGLINGGIYIINRSLLNNEENKFSFEIYLEKHVQDLKIIGYDTNQYFIDIGVPVDYAKAQNDFQKNII